MVGLEFVVDIKHKLDLRSLYLEICALSLSLSFCIMYYIRETTHCDLNRVPSCDVLSRQIERICLRKAFSSRFKFQKERYLTHMNMILWSSPYSACVSLITVRIRLFQKQLREITICQTEHPLISLSIKSLIE